MIVAISKAPLPHYEPYRWTTVARSVQRSPAATMAGCSLFRNEKRRPSFTGKPGRDTAGVGGEAVRRKGLEERPPRGKPANRCEHLLDPVSPFFLCHNSSQGVDFAKLAVATDVLQNVLLFVV